MARGPLAGASGPGKFSKRTDMSLGSTSYGEGVETAALNTAAMKSKTRGIADDLHQLAIYNSTQKSQEEKVWQQFSQDLETLKEE